MYRTNIRDLFELYRTEDKDHANRLLQEGSKHLETLINLQHVTMELQKENSKKITIATPA